MTTSVSILNHGPGSVLVDVYGIVDGASGTSHEQMQYTREVRPNGVSDAITVHSHQYLAVREKPYELTDAPRVTHAPAGAPLPLTH